MVESIANDCSRADAEKMIDNIPVQAALVDGRGQIVAINAYWRQFAEANGYLDPSFGLGRNYLQTCRSADGPMSAEARIVAEGLDDVIHAVRDEFTVIYPCHSPTERRWFRLLASAIRDPGGAVILHFNITPEMLAEERQTASRIESERKLSRIEHEMEKSSRQELRTLQTMTQRRVGERLGLNKKTRAAYNAMIGAIVSSNGDLDEHRVPEMALTIAQLLAKRDAHASDVARLHADALNTAKHGTLPDRARWISQEARLAMIYVLGHLTNIYRESNRP